MWYSESERINQLKGCLIIQAWVSVCVSSSTHSNSVQSNVQNSSLGKARSCGNCCAEPVTFGCRNQLCRL